ncbi:MAG: hypothetical protein R2788_26445 [Saprospiraceae bacterium]
MDQPSFKIIHFTQKTTNSHLALFPAGRIDLFAFAISLLGPTRFKGGDVPTHRDVAAL